MISALLTKLCPSIYRWAIYAVVGAALLATVAGKAYLAGDDHGQAVVRAADAKAQAAIYARFEWNLKDGIRIAGDLAQANAAAQPINVKLQRDIADDIHPLVLAPGAGTALPLLTARAVGMWDRAWSGVQLSGGAAAGIDAGGSGDPAGDAEGASAFDVRDALWSNAREADACWTDIRLYQALLQFERDRAAHAKH